MPNIKDFIDYNLIDRAIVDITDQRKQLMRKNATLRTRLSRLRKLKGEQQQLDRTYQEGLK